MVLVGNSENGLFFYHSRFGALYRQDVLQMEEMVKLLKLEGEWAAVFEPEELPALLGFLHIVFNITSDEQLQALIDLIRAEYNTFAVEQNAKKDFGKDIH